MAQGGCRCGAVRYEVEGAAVHHALCHCRDCQMASGSPMVAWLAIPTDNFRITKGEPQSYESHAGSQRQFCGTCGTPLFFINEKTLPGVVDVQSVTLDDPDAVTPQAQIQTAERRSWMQTLGDLPEFERYPSQ
ncbi:GFA family protein [Altererythrobacter sp. CAU 1778]